MTFVRSTLLLGAAALCIAPARWARAQDNQDNPQIQPREDAPAPSRRPKPRPPAPAVNQPARPAGQPAPSAAPAEETGDSSSRDSQIDLDKQPSGLEPAAPGSNDNNVLLPYDPHRAAKDIEVGNYYLRLKNYRAALDRFNDALLYKPGDAEATFGLAATEEKLDLLSKAFENYQAYLKVLPDGPRAKGAQEAIQRLAPGLNIKQDSSKAVEQDMEVGETYLSTNNFDAARRRFEEVVRLEPENAKACFRLAQSLQGMHRIEPARLYYQKYINLEPQGPFAADAKKAIADINDFLK